MFQLSDEQKQIVAMIRHFAEKEIAPYAPELEHKDEYPVAIVEKMKEIGLFGALIPEAYGGMELGLITYALIIEELTRAWMSITGILNSHCIMAFCVTKFGSEEQRKYWLPLMARGEKRGGLALTEPNAGTDVQAIRTSARKVDAGYIINGTKMFITNGRYGNTFCLLAKTNFEATPTYKGISMFIVEKGAPGFEVPRDISKLGYKGVKTCEMVFEDFLVPLENLIGREGDGFKQIMAGLEIGRINVAARGVGVARAAFEDSIKYTQQRYAFGKPIWEHQAIQMKLADMATKIEAARMLTLAAAEKRDLGERADLEAGMAKLFATEVSMEVTQEALRIHGGYGYTTEFNVERYYRDAPLLVIGEGTNEIQRTVIAKTLIKKYKI